MCRAKVQTTKDLVKHHNHEARCQMLTFPYIHNTFQLFGLSNKSFLIKTKELISRVTALVSQKHLTNLTVPGVKESGSLTIMTVNRTCNVRRYSFFTGINYSRFPVLMFNKHCISDLKSPLHTAKSLANNNSLRHSCTGL